MAKTEYQSIELVRTGNKKNCAPRSEDKLYKRTSTLYFNCKEDFQSCYVLFSSIVNYLGWTRICSFIEVVERIPK